MRVAVHACRAEQWLARPLLACGLACSWLPATRASCACCAARLLLTPAQRLPERIIERAVKGMLPKGRLGRNIRLHLKVYKGAAHPHEAQQPTDITNAISAKPKTYAALAKQQ